MARKGTPVKMPRPSGAWSILFSWRLVIRVALGRSALAALSLGPPRFVRPAPINLPTGPLGAALRPHQRRLWRGRALQVLTRALTFAAGWLLLAALVSSRVTAILDALAWGPAACVVLAGGWLAFAQRPTALETARLLDRRFRLQDALGTAVELSGQGDPEATLPARQRAGALSLLGRAPHNAWAATPRREWLLAGGLAALALVFTLTAPQRSQVVAAGSGHGPHGAVVGSHTLALAQNSQGVRVATSAGITPANGSTSRVTAKARVPLLSLSLQIHTSPQGEQSSTLGATPYLTGGPGGAGGKNAARPAAHGAKGASGSPGGTGAGGQGQPGSGGSPQGGGGGQPGAKGQSGNGLQTPQNGTPGTPNQSGQPNSSGGSGQNQNQGQQQVDNGAGANPSSGSNPFGQDKQSATNPAPGTSRGKAGSQGQQGRQGNHSSTNPKGTRSGAAGKTSVHAPNSQEDPNLLRRGRSGANGLGTRQPRSATHQAGPATGPQISLGGHYVIGTDNSGQGLVRIEPQGTAGGNGLQGAGYAGAPTVQGYIPEDGTTLSPAEQALVRAYFSGDGN
jgi:hypothetical protein